ncbi:MAG: hypothetical protein PVS3B2_00530 [Candidatus Dormibacteraceae bacterium]
MILNSYFGLLRQSPASHHLRAQLANAARERSFCVNASFTKVYRKAISQPEHPCPSNSPR